MSNYSSFSPNAIGVTDEYSDTIELVAGDQLGSMVISLKDSKCATSGVDLDENDSATWKALDLTGVSSILMYFRKIGQEVLHATISCAPMEPLLDGKAVLVWPTGVLDTVSGSYEGEIEVNYNSGKIVSVYDKVKFTIRKDFSGNGAIDD